MGWFTRKPKQHIVTVSYRDLTSKNPPNAEHGYAYVWLLPEAPTVGARVVVPGGDGKPAFAQIAAVDVKPPKGLALKTVSRLVTDAEVAKAHADADVLEAAWLDMAKKAAGFPATTRRRKAPEGFPEIMPVDGDASAQEAGEYGRMWWRATKVAEQRGESADVIKKFKSVASRWYAIRDRG